MTNKQGIKRCRNYRGKFAKFTLTRVLALTIDFEIESASVSNNNVKLLTPLQKRVKPGDKITIIGTLTSATNRGQINLQFGDCSTYDGRCDIPFILDMRPMDKTVHRVIHQAASRTFLYHETDGGFPFQVNEKYVVEIIVHKENYEIHINGNYFTIFNHRLPIDRINHILITMDTIIDSIDVEHVEDKNDLSYINF